MPSRRLVFPVTHAPRVDELLTLRLAIGSTTVIEVAGELDMSTSHILTDLATSVLDEHAPPVLVLDLAALRFFCADGIRALVHVRDAATARSTRLVVRDPSLVTHRVLTLTRMLDAFQVEHTGQAPKLEARSSKLEARSSKRAGTGVAVDAGPRRPRPYAPALGPGPCVIAGAKPSTLDSR